MRLTHPIKIFKNILRKLTGKKYPSTQARFILSKFYFKLDDYI
jgi:hypothetical protein